MGCLLFGLFRAKAVVAMWRDLWVSIGVPGRVLALIVGIVAYVYLIHLAAWAL